MATQKSKVIVALAGNANVGKSVIFNQLTGLHQHVGNWPGKTIERAEGTLVFQGHEVEIIDLPGIYSFSTYSFEEQVSREFIAVEHPDVIINVVDASSLERNLAFTIQLLELEPHLIVALNQIDVAEKKGVIVHPDLLSEALGVPVISTVAVKGLGLTDLISQAIIVSEKDEVVHPLKYGPEIEFNIDRVRERINVDTPYPKRWIAIKLLEGDAEIEEMVYGLDGTVKNIVDEVKSDIEAIHQHDAASVIVSERYAIAQRIAVDVSNIVVPEKTVLDRASDLTTHPVLGYVFMIISILTIFYAMFTFGDYVAGLFDVMFGALNILYYGVLGESAFTVFFWDGVVEGVIGGVVVALPYIAPFYLVLSILEDTGYLARVAYLMDSAMHIIGMHGKGFIPIMLGFGCNVPAILGARIMETKREQLICAFVASLVPCAARSIVIFGLVATYVGFKWAMLLYVFDFVIIFVLGRVAYKVVPGEPVGLIMEMPSYKMPLLKTTVQRTWFRLRGFILEAFPIMIAGNFVIQVASMLGLLDPLEVILSPIIVGWLGLPFGAGVVLIFGVLRKELTLILLASLMGTTDFSLILTPVQMFVFAFVVMVYVPCIATIGALVREFGRRNAAIITVVEVLMAIVLGGIILRVFVFLGIP